MVLKRGRYIRSPFYGSAAIAALSRDIALSITPFLFIVVYTYTRRIKQASRALRKKEGEVVSVVAEVLNSIRVVKAFAREDYEEERLAQRSLENVETALKARSLKAKLAPVVQVIVAVGTCLVLWYGTNLVLTGQITSGALLVFLLYLGKMYKPMRDLSKMTDTMSKAAVGYERIREVIETENDVRNCRVQRRPPISKAKLNSSMSPSLTVMVTGRSMTSTCASRLVSLRRLLVRPAPARPPLRA